MLGSGNLSGAPTLTRPLSGMGHYGDGGSPPTPRVIRPEMRPDELGICEIPSHIGDLMFRLFNAPAAPSPVTLDFVFIMGLLALPMILLVLAIRSA